MSVLFIFVKGTETVALISAPDVRAASLRVGYLRASWGIFGGLTGGLKAYIESYPQCGLPLFQT